MRALGAIGDRAEAVVYADSDSTDGSVERVGREFPNVHVVQVDPSRKMTPARGRNLGMDKLLEVLPDVEFVQLVDGDCDLTPGWLEYGMQYFADHPDVGIISGRLRERDRERNPYHRLADMEWAQPEGETYALGGIMMIRRQVWLDAGGQNADIPAAEEHEFCRRAHEAGWKAMRLAQEMANHDIDMAQFSQWWTRMERMGHSCAQGLWMHRDAPHFRSLVSVTLWGGVVPAVAMVGALPTLGASLPIAGLGYRRLWRRIAEDRRGRGDSDDDAKLYASAMLAAKLAGTVGVARFLLRTLPTGQGGRRG